MREKRDDFWVFRKWQEGRQVADLVGDVGKREGRAKVEIGNFEVFEKGRGVESKGAGVSDVTFTAYKKKGDFGGKMEGGVSGGIFGVVEGLHRGAFGLRIRGAGIGVVAAGWGDGL